MLEFINLMISHFEGREKKMSEIKFTKVEKVDEELLKEIVKRIVNAVNPLKIILFGSYAYGVPKKGSDLDILVVVDNIKDSKRELRLKIRKALREFVIGKDIIVLSAQELENCENIPYTFISSIVRKGKILYEREKF
jgi:predicted nucleotidyltransferase